MSRIAHLARAYGFDVLIVLLTAAAILELVVRRDAADAPRSTPWFAVPAIAVTAATLFGRRRFRFAAPAAYWVLAAALSFVDGRLFPFSSSVFALGMATSYLLGNVRDAFKARVGLAVVFGCAAIVVYNKPGHSKGELVFIPLLFGICWLAGFALREREVAARIAVAEERARIARELHDVVAHAVSVMVLQVGAVRHKLPDSLGDDREALEGVERAGRSALAEMRRLLSAMRRDEDALELAPQPGVDGLDALVQEVGRAGLPVELHVEGERLTLPPAIDLSVYRIAQEGLTNALKHARASRAELALRYDPGAVRIEIRDDGEGPSADDGLGHGLVGIRERVKIYGGDMSAGAVEGGGFVLSARLPLVRDGR